MLPSKKLFKFNIKKLNISSNANKKHNRKTEKNIVSFDIDEDFIRIVVGRFTKQKVIVKKLVEAKTPEDCINDGKIINFDGLLSELEDLISKNKIKGKYGSFTTNSTLIINREIMIPKVEEDEFETVVNYEISKYLPINLNDYVIETLVMENIENEERVKAYTVCYPKKMARSYLDILKELNLKPYSLDIKFNSLNKIINYSQDINSSDYKIDEQNAFIDIGAKYTDVNIYRSGEVDFTRMIKLGYKSYDENIHSSEQQLEYLVEEIERILKFYKNKVRGNKIDKIYLLGDGSRLKGIENYISNRLSIKAEAINQIGFVEFSSKNTNIKDIYKYLNAIGTIIRM